MLMPVLCEELIAVSTGSLVDFAWDEADIQQYFYFAEDELFDRLANLTINANLALMLATTEWVERRLATLAADRTLHDYLEAGWGALGDWRRTDYFQLIDDDWRGPLRGPLAVGIGIICDAFFDSDEEPEKVFQANYAINLVRHILPDTATFETWLEAAIKRLEASHSFAVEGRPVEDILSPSFAEGRLVPREIFNLQRSYQPNTGDDLLAEWRARIPPSNPYYSDDIGDDSEDEHDHPH